MSEGRAEGNNLGVLENVRCKLDYKKVEGYSLDEQQVSCIENDTINTLVVAGAGTGKTTTIIGKIKWILKNWVSKQQLAKKLSEQPPKVLVISFTHSSKEELERRILSEILQDDLVFKIYHPGDFVEVETFHSLALRMVKGLNFENFKLEVSGFEGFLKNVMASTTATDAPDLILTEEKAERFSHLYSLLQNYNVSISSLQKLVRERFRYFWQQDELQKLQASLLKLTKYTREYQESLKSTGSVDFAGLLELAKTSLDTNFSYDYVIIDEYQDISPLEYLLIKKLREIHDFKLFCVGDDWQTIYQFAGSEISLILNFEKCWGETHVFKIERTYRFPEKLAELSGSFIMQNSAQLVKQIRGKRLDEPDQIVEINGPSERIDLNALYYFLLNLPERAKIFLIGRYNFDIRKISHCEYLTFTKHEDKLQIIMRERPDLEISFLSAHKSKGLQADYVFIINCRDATLGFPSRVEEDKLAGLVRELAIHNLSQDKNPKKKSRFFSDFLLERRLSDSDFAFSEERRLFYVAMTRARKKVLFLTVKDKESPFILELRESSNLKTYYLN
ncbi:UvrD-helicase domain-containing protein [Candidatus Saccharibacteria bacterium]|nr:UvrD-helicase domain-containing protein [Candidatus Saccharibacteria bacterium]